MTEFYIEYNPYTVSCIFKQNGEELSDQSTFNCKKEERLQMFLSPNNNTGWLGLPEEIVATCNDKNINLHFKGRKIDYDDLTYCIKEYSDKPGSARFTFYFQEATNDNDIIEELDKIVADIKKKNLPDFKHKNKYGKDIFETYEEVKNNQFDISVIATMSSGKSTLINALLNTDLLPSKNEACTATIARIYDDDTVDGFEAECFNKDRETVYPRAKVDRKIMKTYNEDERVQYIDIYGKIAGIDDSKMNLCLTDTPGPNNSRNEHHGELTKEIIQNKNSVILYVMNATQFGINDDKNLLQLISNEMKKTGKQSHDRFIFVVNKCDEWDVEEDGDLSNLVGQVADYLRKFEILNPIIIPVSALTALSIRKEQNGKSLNKTETKAMANRYFFQNDDYHFEKFATLTPTVRKKLEDELKLGQQCNDDEFEILVHTGIRALEETINEYIDKYAYPIKIADSMRDISGILDELKMVAKFEERISSGEQALEEVRKQIAQSKEKYDKSKVTYENYKKMIVAISFDSDYKRNSRRKVEKELAVLSRPYSSKGMVDKKEADRLIDDYLNKLNDYVRDVEREINLYVEKQVFDKCEKMLNNYKQTINAIFSEIKIGDYDFRKLSSFRNVQISGLDDIKRANSKDRMKEETYYIKNPEREGFWGWFKFWLPREVSRTREVKDGIDVDVKNVVVSLSNVYQREINENIATILSQAEDQIRLYKSTFTNNMDLLDNEITKLYAQLEENLSDETRKKNTVDQDMMTKVWLEKTTHDIDTLLKF